MKDDTLMVPQPISPSTNSLTDSEPIATAPNNVRSPSDNANNNEYYYINRKDKIIATSTSKTNLYIRGLEEDTTDKDLYDLCEK